MKKVLLLSARADHGGGPKHVLELARHLTRSGYDVHVAAPLDAPYGPLFAREFAGHVTLPHRRFSFFKLLRLWLHVRRHGITVVHSHGKGAGVYGRLLALAGVRCFHTFHGLHLHRSLKGRLSSGIERVLALVTEKLVCVAESERARARMLGLPEGKLVVRSNGLDFLRFRTGAGASLKVLGTLTRFDPHKNNHRLLELLAALPGDYRLEIAGSGEEATQLRQAAINLGLRDQVTFHGDVADPADFLTRFGVFVSASLGEGLPFAVLEAIAAERPVVLSKVPGHAGLVPADRLFALNDAAEFVARIEGASKQDVQSLRRTLSEVHQLDRAHGAIEALYAVD